MIARTTIKLDDGRTIRGNIRGRGIDDIDKKALRLAYDVAPGAFPVSWETQYRKTHTNFPHFVRVNSRGQLSGEYTID